MVALLPDISKWWATNIININNLFIIVQLYLNCQIYLNGIKINLKLFLAYINNYN